jgi:hypothetical protein
VLLVHRQENREIRDHALFEAERSGAKQATTDQFKCGKCKQRKTTYYVRSCLVLGPSPLRLPQHLEMRRMHANISLSLGMRS